MPAGAVKVVVASAPWAIGFVPALTTLPIASAPGQASSARMFGVVSPVHDRLSHFVPALAHAWTV
jgi:hypothetical protein